MSEAFERIAMAAAPVFLAQGYARVSLRALAEELGIKAASLYYHCPEGKRQLFVRALRVYLEDYRRRLDAARGRSRFPAALSRLTDWMLDNPPVDAQAVLHPELRPEDAEQLTRAMHAAVLAPFAEVFEDGATRGQVRIDVDPHLAAASVLALVHGLGFAHLPGDTEAARRLVRDGVRLLLDGVRRGP